MPLSPPSSIRSMGFFRRLSRLCGCTKPQESLNRTIFVGNRPIPSTEVIIPPKYPDNRVITSKYTVWNFFPKNLFEQFRRIANFYFLCIAVVQLALREASPVSPATSLAPLIFVVAVTAVKQGYEDWLRHKSDNEVNTRPAFVVRDGELCQIKSQEIKVGDIVHVKLNHSFPCDLVMLSSNNTQGQCYLTTANLDGETNLKVHQSLPETRNLQSVESLSQLLACIECHQPTADLYKFIGIMNVYKESGDVKTSALGPEHLLLRGARLKNTSFIFGCAVYTGQETKMALNSKFTSNKFSTVEKSLNKFLVIFLVLLFSEALICTGLKHWFEYEIRHHEHWYIPDITNGKTAAESVVIDFLAFVILFNYVIPISLYVTIELQKFIGSMFFAWDLELYDENIDQCAKCNSSDLNEELGQVEYLFTDKTGTLTENDMQFRQCSINGIRYQEVGGMLCIIPEHLSAQPEPVLSYSPEIEHFLLVLVLCHTVYVNFDDQLNFTETLGSREQQLVYQASSPDEKALVEACSRFGVVFHGLVGDFYEISFKGEIRKYKLLHLLEFDPNRRCMSVIVQNSKEEYYLLCKGAESSVCHRTISGERLLTLRHVDDYSMAGLRTLVVAHKKLDLTEFQKFDEELTEAHLSLVNREEKLSQVYDAVERDMHLLGATAVEDRLQEGVPETLEHLRLAGIKIWMLTGDKQETAVNISHACGHFKRGMHEFKLVNIKNSEECNEVITNCHKSICEEPLQSYALIVDGASLSFALNYHREKFYEVCNVCTAVLCCRMSPIQKAEVVKLVKYSKSRPITAAIGDGANDVSMLQEAHVGLGIMGKEGRQAARSSDFAFSRFRFLLRVFLVHGHYYYIRVSTLVQYFFYKNMAFITSQVYFVAFTALSGQSVFDSFFLTYYNIFFTSLPILIYGLFEQNISRTRLLQDPTLYRNIRRNVRLSIWQFIKYTATGLWHSVVFFFGVFPLYEKSSAITPDGQMFGLWTFGTLIYTVIVITVNLKLALETHYWTPVTFFSLIITLVGYLSVTFLYTSVKCESNGLFCSSNMFMVFYKLLSTIHVWFIMLFLIVTAIIPDIIMKVVDNFYGEPGNWFKTVRRPIVTRDYNGLLVDDFEMTRLICES